MQPCSKRAFNTCFTPQFYCYHYIIIIQFIFFQHIPNFIVSIQCLGNRIVVGDIQESFHFLRYRRPENQLVIFCDDTNPRWITCSCLLDYNSVAGADKFGNISFVSQYPLLFSNWGSLGSKSPSFLNEIPQNDL